jgi:hypothetical protein
MKKILTIALLFILKFGFAQHIIITFQNDTIEAQILSMNDSAYNYKRIQKPRVKQSVLISNVRRIIPYGDDTIFDIFTDKVEPKFESLIIDSGSINTFDETKTQSYWLNRAGEQMNNAITLNLLGTLCIAASPLLIQTKEETKFITSSGVSTPYKTTSTDASLSYISTGVGLLLNVISVVSWYQCSEAFKMASQQQKFSFKASPVGASVAFRF